MYSFALSAFCAIATALTITEQADYSQSLSIWLSLISYGYGLYGMIISIWLYGRKADHDAERLSSKRKIFNLETGSLCGDSDDEDRRASFDSYLETRHSIRIV